MSGHSHFSRIKYKKAITDAKRGKIFSKLSQAISVAAREKGVDPAINPKLRLAIEEARSFNLPKENIERAIKRGAGELEGAKLEEVLFEAYGPGGTAIIIEGITDNKNRTLSEIKQILSQNNGKLASEGSVKWLFERRGCLIINRQSQDEALRNKEKIELKVIEAGAQDIYWKGDLLDVYTSPEELEKVKQSLEEKNIKIESSSLDWVAKEMIELDEKNKEACQKLFEALEESETVQEIYSNLRI
jgi:YebC/PmpR family DNA-binding regulatory protein